MVYIHIMSEEDNAFLACRDCRCSALRRASRTITQHYETCFRGTGLRATQFTLLATLAQMGPLALGSLASALGLERTTLTRNLRALEKRGFVHALSEKDRRVRKIEITKEGREAALSALDAWKLAQSTADEVLARTGLKF